MPIQHTILLFLLVILLSVNACSDANQIRKEQLMTSGLILYRAHCQNCHGADGKGLGKLYPPLAQSDFLLKNPGITICGIKNGFSEKMIVNGKLYEQAMPANPALKDRDIAQIMTYINNAWNNNSPLTETDSVKNILEKCVKK